MLEAIDLEVTPPGASRPAIRGVSLRLGRGDWLAVVGENGGGKTSLLLALAGLWSPSGGTVALDGRPIGYGRGLEVPRGVAVVMQDPSSQLLQPTVADEVAFTARNLGWPEPEVAASVARWVKALGLEEELPRDPVTLSAGRQQLVLLAAALATGPRILIADEPTAHIDPSGRDRILAAISREVASGLAVAWATQDPAEAAAATRTLVVAKHDEAGVNSHEAEDGGPRDIGGVGGSRPASSSDGIPVLVIEVSAAVAMEGPRVRIGSPLRIPIPPSGVTALVGPNAVGKSVVLAGAAGLESVAQIRAYWSGSPKHPPIMALQFPEQQVFEEVVADEVIFAAEARGMDRPTALAAAAAGLSELGLQASLPLERRTWTLSTGEKRLIEVLGALIAPASLVVLDEPTAGLDRARREALSRLVRNRAAQGPVLVASQDREWVDRVGARVVDLGTS